jgi:hypothetical protein
MLHKYLELSLQFNKTTILILKVLFPIILLIVTFNSPVLAQNVGPIESHNSSLHSSTDASPNQTTHTFALIGDQPYSVASEKVTTELLNTLNEDETVPWILHVGDIKGGGESCSDELLNKRINQLLSIPKPIVLIPGDNEWADCHRSSNGGFRPLERLAYLRAKAFNPNSKLMPTGHPKQFKRAALQVQAGYPEHAMWAVSGTLFITLNITGSNNNLENPNSRNNSQKEVQVEYEQRMKAVKAWMAQGVQEFKQHSELTELVVAMQGNPIDGSGASLSKSSWLGGVDGYKEFRDVLSNVAEQINRPVLLIHGDTHRLKWDEHQLNPSRPNKINRLEGWGYPFLRQWVKVTIRSGADNPFGVESISVN